MNEINGSLITANYNALLKRWNEEESQGNLYFVSAAGALISGSKTEPAVYAGISSDWETQRIYFAYENRFLYGGNIEQSVFQRGRIGFAPYVGDYNQVHTWLILQVDYKTVAIDKFVVTPLIRLFWSNVLVEFGITSNRRILFNWVVRW